MNPRTDKLKAYRDKRSAARSPEPFGGEATERPGLFVVQKHRARRLHHDLRLEVNGVLHSWAVPQGPSPDPSVKRLAVETEDHPLEYADFEGIIPAGNYGAGAMIVWDRGLWLPQLNDPSHGWDKGKLLFELRGYKLRGLWTLFRTREQGQWLLMKKPDAWATTDSEPFAEESILSGLSVEELAEGHQRAPAIRESLRQLGAPTYSIELDQPRPMLAQTAPRPFSRTGWIFELKYDGYRMLASCAEGRARLLYRSGREATRSFPELARAAAALPYQSLVLDAEVVVLDGAGRADFQRLQHRAQLTRGIDCERAALSEPASLCVFDLLGFEGHDLRELPLLERKRLLKLILPRAGPISYADHLDEQGLALFREARKLGLEGIMAKRAASTYRSGRSPDWLKLKADHTDDFVVVGWTAPRGSRSGFGALHLGVHQDGELVYAGRVGSGFRDSEIADIHKRLAETRRAAPACSGVPSKRSEDQWVRPAMVVEVRYLQWTRGGQLRQPVFLRLRPDKAIEGCVLTDTRVASEPPPPTSTQPLTAERKLTLSRLDKLFWPESGYTKGDLLEYYRAVSPWLLPYLKDRPVVLVRHPDGISGKSFFQKRPPEFVPEWIRSESLWSEDSGEELNNFIVEDLSSLLYLINLGTIPLHIWSSRLGSIAKPDWCILDLDPKQAPFSHVVRIAREIHSLCASVDLPHFLKTSGSSGLHVLIPLAGQLSHDQSRQLAEIIARIVADRHREIATTARAMAARGGRVYIDALQNGHGKLLVAPFSVRALPGAPASTPLAWHELRSALEIGRFNLKSVPRRLPRLKQDPWESMLGQCPDLPAALEGLAAQCPE